MPSPCSGLSLSSEDIKELQLIFNVTIEDIRFIKQQIWNTVYLTVLSINSIYQMHRLGEVISGTSEEKAEAILPLMFDFIEKTDSLLQRFRPPSS